METPKKAEELRFEDIKGLFLLVGAMILFALAWSVGRRLSLRVKTVTYQINEIKEADH